MLQRFTFLFALSFLALQAGAQVVIWGDQTGQGDFAGSLGDWTVDTPSPTTDSSWLWSPDGDVGGGALAAAGTVITSATASNGVAMYDYDFQTTGGGAITGQAVMSSHLISPVIDITGATKSLAVRFSQILRWFQSVTDEPYSSISFSTDGGASWSERENCNPFVPNASTLTNWGVTDNTVTINIPQDITTGADSLMLRFTFAGNFYYWGIDDVMVIEREDYDVSANPFFAIAPSYQTPKSQVGNIGFLIDVQNWGDQPITDVNVTAEITAPDGSSLFTATNPYGTLDIDSTYENVPFPDYFEGQELDPGVYNVSYTVSTADNDTEPTNDMQSYDFTITDSIFALDSGPTHYFEIAGAAYDAGDDHSLFYGAFYHIPNGAGYFADKAVISIQGTDGGGFNLANQVVAVKLYEWVDSDGDFTSQESERELVSLGIYTITGSEGSGGTPSVQVVDMLGIALDEAPALKDDTDYILMMEFDSPSEEADLPIGISLEHDYSGNSVLGSQVDYVSQYASFITLGTTDTDFNRFGLGYRVDPVARLTITTSDPTPVRNIPGIKEITLSPNPVKDMLTVAVDGTEDIGEVNIVIFDVNGMAIQYDNYDFTGNSNYSLSVEHLASGQYYFGIKSDKGQHFTPFQVQR